MRTFLSKKYHLVIRVWRSAFLAELWKWENFGKHAQHVFPIQCFIMKKKRRFSVFHFIKICIWTQSSFFLFFQEKWSATFLKNPLSFQSSSHPYRVYTTIIIPSISHQRKLRQKYCNKCTVAGIHNIYNVLRQLATVLNFMSKTKSSHDANHILMDLYIHKKKMSIRVHVIWGFNIPSRQTKNRRNINI